MIDAVIEIIFVNRLAFGRSHNDDFRYASFNTLLNNQLHNRPIAQRQHCFRNSFSDWQVATRKTRVRDNCFGWFFYLHTHSYDYTLSRISFCAKAGFAFPPVFFIICPTKKPITLSLPARISDTALALFESASTSSTTAPIAPSSLSCSRFFCSAIVRGAPPFSMSTVKISLAADELTSCFSTMVESSARASVVSLSVL